MQFNDVYIPYSHYWSTPFCKWQGEFSNQHSLIFAAKCARKMLDDNSFYSDHIEQLHYGHTVPQQGAFYGAPWVAALIGNDRITGPTLSQACATSARVLASAATEVQLGGADIVLAMAGDRISNGPLLSYPNATAPGGAPTIENWVLDNFSKDPYADCAMVQTAENVAEKYQISRDQQDEFAVGSQNKAEAAQKAGKFADEIAAFTVKGRKGDTIVDQDEYIRHGATMEAMQKLRPAFTKDGTVTAANASGLNDGAAATLLMSAEEAQKRGIEPLARIVSYATAGLDPTIMGVGPIYASRKALEKAGWSVGDLDLIEANEAFAAQACAVNKDMGWDTDKVNVNGGAIALGHPTGASGARIVVTMMHEMERRAKAGNPVKYGLATLCVGVGMGVATVFEWIGE